MADAVSPGLPPAPFPQALRPSRRARWFLLALYVLAIVWGLRNIHFWEPSGLDLLLPIMLALLLGWWGVEDARERRRPIPILTQHWFLFGAGLLVPGYVLWSRRWLGLGWLLLHGVLWTVISSIVMHLGGVLVFGRQWLRALGI